MPIYFALQSNREARVGPPKAPSRAGGRRVRTSAYWLAYFRGNAARQRPIPWDGGAGPTPEQLAAIARSLQAWQLGETSEGRHLREAAARYAQRVGDPLYPAAVELFIREEQRH